MERQEDTKISRRQFFAAAVPWSAVLGYLAWTTYKNVTETKKLYEAYATPEAIVRSTDNARTEQSLTEQLEKLPLKTKALSFRLDLELGKINEIFPAGGSATITEYDNVNKLAYLLTAGHVASILESNNTQAIRLTQPHYNNAGLVVEKDRLAWKSHQNKDLGIIGIKLEDDISPESSILNYPDTSWTPNNNDTLYSLTFPKSAKKHNHVYPVDFKLSPQIYEPDDSEEFNYTGYLANISLGKGASGASVALHNGAIIGVFTERDNETGGSLICPVGNEYYGLRDDVASQLLHKS